MIMSSMVKRSSKSVINATGQWSAEVLWGLSLWSEVSASAVVYTGTPQRNTAQGNHPWVSKWGGTMANLTVAARVFLESRLHRSHNGVYFLNQWCIIYLLISSESLIFHNNSFAWVFFPSLQEQNNDGLGLFTHTAQCSVSYLHLSLVMFRSKLNTTNGGDPTKSKFSTVDFRFPLCTSSRILSASTLDKY